MSAPGIAPDADVRARADVLDGFFESFWRLNPVTATFAGVHEHDEKLPDWSNAGLDEARDERYALRRALKHVVADTPLVRQDWSAVDVALAESVLEIQDMEFESRHFVRRNPCLAVGEALFGLVALAWDEHRDIAGRCDAIRARLHELPGFLSDATEALGVSAIPVAWRERAERECDAGMDLVAGIVSWVSAEQPGSREPMHEAGRHASVALHRFKDDLQRRQEAPDERYAIGEDRLPLIARHGHWCETPIEDLRREAKALLEEERARLGLMLREVGASSWPEVADRLAADHPAPEAVLHTCHATWVAARQLADGHVTWPGLDVRYRVAPEWARVAAPRLYYLNYRSPAPLAFPPYDRYAVPPLAADADAAATGQYFRLWNRSAIKLNHVAHHGGLGHHVQNWHAARSPSRIGRITAVDGASRIAAIQGGTMAEGWACYATEVMEALGFLTPDERVSEQHTRVRLMVRAVVDLELHTGRLSFDDAVRFHEDMTGVSNAAARGEVTRCSMFPGTAMMYWLGLRGLNDLRRAEEARLGTAFDVRAFHDAVLQCGSIPVPLIARLFAERAA